MISHQGGLARAVKEHPTARMCTLDDPKPNASVAESSSIASVPWYGLAETLLKAKELVYKGLVRSRPHVMCLSQEGEKPKTRQKQLFEDEA